MQKKDKTLLTNDDSIIAAVNAAPKTPVTRSWAQYLTEIAAFEKEVKTGQRKDYDGYGRLVVDNQVITNSHTYLQEQKVIIQIPHKAKIKDIRRIYGGRAKIQWFDT